MPNIEVEGHDFHYMEIDGEGPTILMLCSTGLDSRQWNDALPLLEGRRLLCLHYLCYPKSADWSGDGEVDSMLDYLAAERLLLGEEGAVDILGHSYGGFIGLRLAKSHPEKVRRMSFHEPTVWGCLQSTSRDDLKNEFGEVVETFFTEGLSPEDFLQDFVDYWNVSGTWGLMTEHRKEMWRSLQPKILSEVRLLCYDKTPSQYYESIRHPILITLSNETPPHQFEACSILSRSLGDVRVENVPGGHMGVITESGFVMPLLAGWLNRES
jgi:pimeloyl-ACP methyl ester carboxylesterase